MKQAISAQNTKMYMSNPNAAPQATGAVLTASKSSPVMVTVDDVSRLSNGDPVSILGTGWTSIDGQSWVLQNLNRDSKSATLAGSNATREADDARVGAFRLDAFADVCAVSYSITPTAAAEIDTTTLCDDKKTSLVGFRDPGSLTFDFFINPVDGDYQALSDAYDDGEEREFLIRYRNGAVRTLPVIVQTISESGGVDQAIQGSATLKITRAPILTMPDTLGDGDDTYDLIISVSPGEGDAPLAVALTLTEFGNAATQFSIDWGDDSPPEVVVAPAAVHTYHDPGEFRVRVTPTVQGYPTAPFSGPLVVVNEPAEAEPEGEAQGATQ